jgi:chromosome segregation ATPase
MTILRRIGGGVLFVLAVLTSLAAVVGTVGAWWGKGTVDETSLATIELLTSSMGLAEQAIANVDGRLEAAEQEVGRFQERINALGASEGDIVVDEELQRTVRDRVLPQLDRFAAEGGRLYTSLAAYNQTAGQLNQLRAVRLPTMSAELAQLEAQIQQAAAQAEELKATLKQPDGAELLALSERIEQGLGSARSTLALAQPRVANVEAALVDVQGALPFWTTLSASMLTALLILFAAGQLSLAVHAWGWMRRA